MDKKTNNQTTYLEKLGIDSLNQMQTSALNAILHHREVILTSPTGTGKTLAYLLPLLQMVDTSMKNNVQVIIVVPARELGIQIEQVLRNMATGLKINAVYGGRSVKKDKEELSTLPTVLIGTPGRIADHLHRGTVDTSTIKHLVLDEFDKSLEIGFDDDMSYICDELRHLDRKVLCSATSNIELPHFVGMKHAEVLNFHEKGGAHLAVQTIYSPEKDKLETLRQTLLWLNDQTGIVFCNYKDSIERISTYLSEHHIHHGVYHGGLEQRDRERALIKFRNGSFHVLLSTDLAARGLDIPDITYLIHYHLPHHKHEYVHRNGRTARMSSDGNAYILRHESDTLPDYITKAPAIHLGEPTDDPRPAVHTLFVSGGRKDKISKGDIAGFLCKQGGLEYAQIGNIELKTDCAFVGIETRHPQKVADKVNNQRLKKKKVRVYII